MGATLARRAVRLSMVAPSQMTDLTCYLPFRSSVSYTDASAELITYRRTETTAEGRVEWYFIYNHSSSASSQQVVLTGTGVPEVVNLWSGAISPLAFARVGAAQVSVKVELGSKAALVVCIRSAIDPSPYLLIASIANILSLAQA